MKALITSIALVLIIGLCSPVFGYEILKPYVNDFTGTLNINQTDSLNKMAALIENTTTYEVAMVLVNDTKGEDRLMYATKLGDQNGVGKAATDNGLVILWSFNDDKGGAIAVGRGAESVFNDAKVSRWGRDVRDKYWNNGSYYEGFAVLLMNIGNELKVNVSNYSLYYPPAPFGFANNNKWVTIVAIILGVLAFFLIIKTITKNDDERKGSGFWSGAVLGSILSSGRSSGSSGSSGGGSFGGGSFGGGGGKF